MRLMANYKGPSKFIQTKGTIVLTQSLKFVLFSLSLKTPNCIEKSNKTINSVPSSVQTGQIIYEWNLGWIV